MTDQTVVRKPGDGKAFWMLGGLYEVKAASDETGGPTVMEMTMPAGSGPPPHIHSGTETVYVVAGTVKYHVGDEVVDAGPGTLFHIPAGTLEFFEATTEAKVLATYMPGGIEGFFAEAGEVAERHELPPPTDGPPDVERLAAIASRYGLTIQAPTPV